MRHEDDENKKDRLAAVDLGTNSNRLLIADANGVPLYRDVRHVALGDGLAETGYFSEASIERAICSFMDFKSMMELYGVVKYRAIATAACRMCENAEPFVKEVKKASGIDLEIISEFEEARLTLLGAKLNAPQDKPYLFVYDLGGGSTEITLATNEAQPRILETVSVPLGARNATEIFHLRDYHAKGAEELEKAVKKYVDGFLDKIKLVDYKGRASLVATSSTPLRLAAFVAKDAAYDKFASDGRLMTIDDLNKTIAQILTMDFAQRAASPYIGHRADIFVAALIIFRTIYLALGCEAMTASLKGAQEAIIAELSA